METAEPPCLSAVRLPHTMRLRLNLHSCLDNGNIPGLSTIKGLNFIILYSKYCIVKQIITVV